MFEFFAPLLTLAIVCRRCCCGRYEYSFDFSVLRSVFCFIYFTLVVEQMLGSAAAALFEFSFSSDGAVRERMAQNSFLSGLTRFSARGIFRFCSTLKSFLLFMELFLEFCCEKKKRLMRVEYLKKSCSFHNLQPFHSFDKFSTQWAMLLSCTAIFSLVIRDISFSDKRRELKRKLGIYFYDLKISHSPWVGELLKLF